MKICKSIGFISEFNPANRTLWSGIHYTIFKLLKGKNRVEWVDPEIPFWLLATLKARKAFAIFGGKNYDWTHAVSLSKRIGRTLSRKLRDRHYDLLFASAASSSLAFLETDIPIIYLSDTTFHLVNDYYGKYSNLSNRNVEDGELIERRALEKATRVILSSGWARESAIHDYGINPAKIHVIPFAPNIERIPAASEVRYGKSDSLNLLFVGIDWKRKGGSTAIKIHELLKERYPQCRLRLVGGMPDEEISDPRIEPYGFLDKNDRESLEKLCSLYLDTDFLVHPTQAEAAGIVFAESAAFGVPSLTYKTGGVADYVQNDVNGFIFPAGTSEAAFVEAISAVYDDPLKYEALRKSTRQMFEQNFSRGRWVERFDAICDSLKLS